MSGPGVPSGDMVLSLEFGYAVHLVVVLTWPTVAVDVSAM